MRRSMVDVALSGGLAFNVPKPSTMASAATTPELESAQAIVSPSTLVFVPKGNNIPWIGDFDDQVKKAAIKDQLCPTTYVTPGRQGRAKALRRRSQKGRCKTGACFPNKKTKM